MIDFVRIHYKDKARLEPYVLDENNFPFLLTTLEYHSDDIQYPYKAKTGFMDIVITEKIGYVKNSIHKQYNYMRTKEKQNYSDFTYSQLCETIDDLGTKIIDIKETRLTQLEFGLNITTNVPAEQIIRNNILMHKYRGYNHNQKFNGKGELKRFDHSNYLIKVYDKAKQFELEENLLRFEIRLSRKEFSPLGINNLNSLKCVNILDNLLEYLIKRFDEMTIIDPVPSGLPQKDRESLYKYKDPNYWQVELAEKSGQTHMRHKSKFQCLIDKYDLGQTKRTLRAALQAKYEILKNN